MASKTSPRRVAAQRRNSIVRSVQTVTPTPRSQRWDIAKTVDLSLSIEWT